MQESDPPIPLEVFQYYYLTFGLIKKNQRELIARALGKEPRGFRIAYWNRKLLHIRYSGQKLWDEFREFLNVIEGEMARIIRKHSPFYWIHFYRRIGLGLYEDVDGPTDGWTLNLVRRIMEIAFRKYGDTNRTDDVALSSEVSDDAILGGLILRSMKNDGLSKESIERFFSDIRISPQWVLTDFTEETMVEIFRLEGLAYEYWKASANMRAVGKDGGIIFDDEVGYRHSDGRVFTDLINSLDSRTEKYGGTSTLLGTFIYPRNTGRAAENFHAITAHYNVDRIPIRDVLPPDLAALVHKDSLHSNFIIQAFNIDRFLHDHRFIEGWFKQKFGIELETYLFVIVLLDLFAFGKYLSDDEGTKLQRILELYRRAYSAAIPGDDSALFTAISELRQAYAEHGGVPEISRAEFDKALALLSLDDTSRQDVALWALHVGSILIPTPKGRLFDFYAVAPFVANLPHRFESSGDDKGTRFEDVVREFLTADGIAVLPNRKLAAKDGTEREVDVAVSSNDNLYLFDCMALSQAIDYEIGNPKTVNYRRTKLTEKLEQVRSLRKFIARNPIGRNYDFSDAKNIIIGVVTPYCEWVWSRESKYWLDEKTPAFVSPLELSAFLKRKLNL